VPHEPAERRDLEERVQDAGVPDEDLRRPGQALAGVDVPRLESADKAEVAQQIERGRTEEQELTGAKSVAPVVVDDPSQDLEVPGDPVDLVEDESLGAWPRRYPSGSARRRRSAGRSRSRWTAPRLRRSATPGQRGLADLSGSEHDHGRGLGQATLEV
jgi:hypothetical protein